MLHAHLKYFIAVYVLVWYLTIKQKYFALIMQ